MTERFIHLSHFSVSDNREIHSSLPLFLLMNYSEYRLAATWETSRKSCKGKSQQEIKLVLQRSRGNWITGINSWLRKGALLLAQDSATLQSFSWYIVCWGQTFFAQWAPSTERKLLFILCIKAFNINLGKVCSWSQKILINFSCCYKSAPWWFCICSLFHSSRWISNSWKKSLQDIQAEREILFRTPGWCQMKAYFSHRIPNFKPKEIFSTQTFHMPYFMQWTK